METQEIIEVLNSIEPMTKRQIIIYIISAVLGSSVLNGFITHMLYNRKLKKEQKVKFENMIGEKIANALLYVYEITTSASSIEVYNAEDKKADGSLNLFDRNAIYPAIMNDGESLDNFTNMIHKCRTEYEKYLDCALALQIVYIERYMEQLKTYSAKHGGEQVLPTMGTIFIVDIQRWQKKCDKMLIRRMNKSKCRLDYHQGKKWQILREWFIVRQWEKSFLYKIMEKERMEEKLK